MEVVRLVKFLINSKLKLRFVQRLAREEYIKNPIFNHVGFFFYKP